MKNLILALLIVFSIQSNAQFTSTGGPSGGGFVDNIYAEEDWAFVGMNEKAWRTLDGGDTWEMLTNSFPNSNVAARCFSYLGNDLYFGCGNHSRCYKSSNNGDSWEAFNAGLPNVMGNPTFVPEMMLTSDERLFFAGTNFGIAYIEEGDTEWSFTQFSSGYIEAMSLLGPDSIWVNFGGTTYYSHDNGGSFTQLPSEPLSGFGLAATDFIESNGRIIACTNGGGGNTVYYSDNYGTSWTLCTTGFALGEKLVKINGELYGLGHDGIYKSTDNGINWTNVLYTGFNTGRMMDDWKTDEILLGLSSGIYEVENPATPVSVAASTPGADILNMVETSNALLALTPAGLYSWNGSAWNPAYDVLQFSTTLNSLYADGNNVYLCTGAGLYLSTDNGASFSQLDANPVQQIIINGSNWVRSQGGVVSFSTDSGGSWTNSTFLSSLPLFYSVRHLGYHNGYYFAGGFGALLRSADNGATWEVLSDYNMASKCLSFDGALVREHYGYDYITGEVQISTDNGSTWSVLHDGINTVGFYIGCSGLFTSGNTLYTYGTEPGLEGLLTLTDTEGTWALQPNSGGLPVGALFSGFVHYNDQFYIATKGNSVWRLGGGIIDAVQENEGAELMVYPNPAEDWLTIQASQALGTITITDLQGRAVLTSQSASSLYSLDITGLGSGVYVVRAGENMRRIVKQ